VKVSKTDPLALEARATIRPWRTRLSPLIAVAGFGLTVVAGKAVADGHVQVAILSVGTLASLALFHYLELPTWCSLLLVTAVAARGLRDLLGLPEIVDFLHYPVVLLFALAAADRPSRAAARSPGRWLGVFLLVVLLSAIAHPDDPMRAVLFVLIAGEPLVVIWAIARWGADDKTVRAVGTVAILLASIQIPIAVYQGMAYGWSDPVQGTLQGHGAGSHVLGGLFALALFVVIAALLAKRISAVVGGAGVAVCFGMMLATGSLSVLVIASFAAVFEPLIAPFAKHPGERRRGKLAPILLSVVVGTSVLILVGTLTSGFYGRVVDLATSGDEPGFDIVWERATSDPLAMVLGSGPGTSASRASLLLVGAEPGSPLEFIGLEPTDLGIALRFATATQVYGGSVESAASSALGIMGDLGIVGIAALVMLFVALWKHAGRSSSWLAPAARAALLLVVPLSLIDNWLEYPEFAIPFAILIGFVVSQTSDRPAQTSRLYGLEEPAATRL
jgi:hypothetical protein